MWGESELCMLLQIDIACCAHVLHMFSTLIVSKFRSLYVVAAQLVSRSTVPWQVDNKSSCGWGVKHLSKHGW